MRGTFSGCSRGLAIKATTITARESLAAVGKENNDASDHSQYNEIIVEMGQLISENIGRNAT